MSRQFFCDLDVVRRNGTGIIQIYSNQPGKSLLTEYGTKANFATFNRTLTKLGKTSYILQIVHRNYFIELADSNYKNVNRLNLFGLKRYKYVNIVRLKSHELVDSSHQFCKFSCLTYESNRLMPF